MGSAEVPDLFRGASFYPYHGPQTLEIHNGPWNCDGLSRLPLPQMPADQPDEVELNHVNAIETLLVTEQALWRETNQVVRVVESGWTNIESGWTNIESHPDIAPYASRKHELTLHHAILMWGMLCLQS